MTPHNKKGFFLLGGSWLLGSIATGLIGLGAPNAIENLTRDSFQPAASAENPQMEAALTVLYQDILNTAYQSVSDRTLILTGVGILFGSACIILGRTRFRL